MRNKVTFEIKKAKNSINLIKYVRVKDVHNLGKF